MIKFVFFFVKTKNIGQQLMKIFSKGSNIIKQEVLVQNFMIIPQVIEYF